MRNILQDTTNVKKGKISKTKLSDKDSVLEFIKEVYNTTQDYNLKYDLSKCIEIIEGKENQEVRELKGALEEIIQENEELIDEKTRLYLELQSLRNENSDNTEKEDGSENSDGSDNTEKENGSENSDGSNNNEKENKLM